MTTQIAHFIAGQHTAGGSNRTQDVTNPASGKVTGKVVLAAAADVDAAVAAAQAAFPKWADTPPIQKPSPQPAPAWVPSNWRPSTSSFAPSFSPWAM